MSNKKWTITHIHSTPVFYVETQIGRKPQNTFFLYVLKNYNSLEAPTSFVFQLQLEGGSNPLVSSCYNLREAPTPQFSNYNQK